MKKYIYPAIFAKEHEGGYSIRFPDLKGCFSEGDTWEEAFEMAKDALGLYIEDLICNKKEIPAASDISALILEENEQIAIIELDMDDYYRKHDTRSVKKTLTIPIWLNNVAEKYGINYSQLLQEAIKQKLNL